ncbi:MAG: gfo/Idh/MocA family oxidoreductase, partial [Spirochaetaceae bacterium]
EYAVQALEAGYHVFCEKPLARSMEDASKITEAARRTGRFVAVGQCLRFWPAYTEAKKIIESGTYGAVRHAEFARYSPPATWAIDNWLAESKKSGNAALDLHVHDVDMIVFLFGKPTSLRSVGIPDGAGSFSHISTVYSYPDKSVLSTGGWAFPPSYPFNMIARWVMEKGAMELDFSRESVLTLYPESGEPKPVPLPPGDGYFHELQDFVTRVETGKAPDVVSADNAAASLEVTLLEIESARTGKEVSLA